MSKQIFCLRKQAVVRLAKATGFSIICFLCLCQSIQAQTTAFTYQGKLSDGGVEANGQYDLTFRLFDAAAGGTQVGSDVVRDNVRVTTGVFTVSLDFGSSPFNSATGIFLEISVRPGASTGTFTPLTPLQPITSSPYAIKTSNATSADSLSAACVLCVTDGHVVSIDAGKITGVLSVSQGGTGIGPAPPPADTYLRSNGFGWTASGLSGNGSGLTNLNGANITNNTINASALASDTFPNNRNLSLLGSLRWDLLGQRVSVGNNPDGVAFDGANIWVANTFSNNVTKLRASDGVNLGNFAGGTGPVGIAFDGTNLWVANTTSNNVTKLRASDGALQGTFAVGSGPRGVAFDGANIWVANQSSSNVTKLRASDGALLGTFAVGNFPVAVAFDGANIWVTNQNSNNVTKLQASDGALQGTFAVGTNPRGVAFDGANIWVANSSSSNVTKLRASDGAPQGTFAVGTTPWGVAFDGANIWVVNGSSNNVTKLRASDGANLGTFAAGTGPQGVAFDGANIWVTNFFGNNVIKLPVFP